jgi:hypothetical protein
MGDMVVVRKEGLYCVPGDFYIDPWRPVDRAVITHAHGDHARWGHKHYLASEKSVNILKSRLGADINIDGLEYGERIVHNGVAISLHPAGHVLGSAQVRMEHEGEIWVASGDYKVEPDATCAPFEPVRCHTFITESTFGLPIYRWDPQQEVFDDINRWWRRNADERPHQRAVRLRLRQGPAPAVRPGPSIGPIVCHGAVEPLNRVYREGGVRTAAHAAGQRDRQGRDEDAPWCWRRRRRRLDLDAPLRRLQRCLRQRLDAAARGAPAARRRPRLRAVRPRRLARPAGRDPATGAQQVVVTHGSIPVMVRWLCQIGLDAKAFDTEYGDDEASRRRAARSRRRRQRGRRPMREFARLYAELDETTATNRKLEALQNYFEHTAPENAAWAVYFLAGGKPRQAVPTKLLREAAIEYAGLDEWLFDESHAAVGDTAETIAHILPAPKRNTATSAWPCGWKSASAPCAAPTRASSAPLFAYWDELTWRERFLFVKLIGGGFRVGVSKLLVTRALAAIAAVDAKLIAQRLMGWTDGRVRPTAAGFLQLIAAQSEDEHKLRGGQPYPFFLAHQLNGDPATLGDMSDWQVEWKYDGIRAQLVRRGGQNYLWSRGEDLITERFPELAALSLPEGTVVDGEVLIWLDNDSPAPFADLQKRIGRKTLSSQAAGRAAGGAAGLRPAGAGRRRPARAAPARAARAAGDPGHRRGQAAAAHLAAGHGRHLG